MRISIWLSALTVSSVLAYVATAQAAVAPMNERISLERVSVSVDGVEASASDTDTRPAATLSAQSVGLVFSSAQPGQSVELYDAP